MFLTHILQPIFVTGYCEENIDSMASLCNTIAGDAPLFTMFRKDGALVKCPFRGPHSFSYSKGDSGQVCKYPLSFMDTCSDNERLKLRYQACLDVEGSEIASKCNLTVFKAKIGLICICLGEKEAVTHSMFKLLGFHGINIVE